MSVCLQVSVEASFLEDNCLKPAFDYYYIDLFSFLGDGMGDGMFTEPCSA